MTITRKQFFHYLLLVGIFALMVAIVCYVLPHKQSNFKYFFEVGKPWGYELLTAEEDIPIYKTDAQLAAEKSELLSTFYPYFSLRGSSVNAKADDFKELGFNRRQAEYLETAIRDIHSAGIVSAADMKMLVDSGYKRLVAVDKRRVASTRQVSRLLTPRSAYSTIIEGAPSGMDNKLKTISLESYLDIDLVYDSATTHQMRDELLSTISLTQGMVQTGERIIDRGEIVTEQTWQILNSMRIAWDDKAVDIGQTRLSEAGLIIFVFIICCMLVMYLLAFRRHLIDDWRNMSFFCVVITLMVVISCLLLRFTNLSLYLVPFAWVPIIVRVFYDSRTGFMAHLTTCLLVSLAAPAPYEFLTIQLIIGLIAVASLRDMSVRSQLATTAAYLFVAYTLLYTVFTIASTGSWQSINLWTYAFIFANSLLVLLAYGLIYLVEKAYGFISAITLVELTNVNSNLMIEFSQKAPGTFQHSLQVSNLATEAAKSIGANTLLIRAGALYHDIGKMPNAENFTENQTAGANPLSLMSYEEAAKLIIDHVSNGVQLARRHRLPQVIVSFIQTHHGTSKVRYFYNSWINAHPGEQVDESLFTYPGPNPFTKETTILMMADAVEARSRSLSVYTEESISDMVEQMISTQIADGQFADSPLSFKDIEKIKAVFKERIIQMNHHRIAYPEVKK